MPAQYQGNAISKAARAAAGGGFESAITNAGGAGYIAFDVPVVKHSTTGGTMPVRLVRRRGSSGSLTVQLSATDKFRAQGVHSYAGESVTFADGEMIKVIDIPLNPITLDGEAHFYLNVTITNALIPGVRWHELNTLVIVDDGSIWSGGTVLDDPSTQIIQDACVDNSIIYLRTGVWNDFSVPGYAEMNGNDGRKGSSFRDKTNLVIRNYPSESPAITCTATQGAGLYIRSNNYVFVSGIEFYGGGAASEFLPIYIKEITAGSPDEYVYITDCHIHDWYGEDNTGGIRCDDGYRCVAFNNKIHDGYYTRESSNTITSEPYGLHAGVHGYKPVEFFVYQNTIYHVKRAMFRKQPEETPSMTNLFARNLVYAIEGEAASYEYAGSEPPTYPNFDVAVFENICLDCNAVDIKSSDDVSTDDSKRALIHNNLIRNGGIFDVREFKDIQFWNNLVIGGSTGSTIATSLDGRNPGEITYADYNGYEKNYRYIFGRNTVDDFRSYDSFAAWQSSDESQSVDNQAPANPDANGALGTPVFAGVDDWHLDETDTLFRNQGRFAQESIGAYRLGHEQIGATI